MAKSDNKKSPVANMANRGMTLFRILFAGWKAIDWKCPVTRWLLLVIYPVGAFLMGYFLYFLELPGLLLPEIFTAEMMDSIGWRGRLVCGTAGVPLYLVWLLFCLGLPPWRERADFERALGRLAMKSGDGTAPVLVAIRRIDPFKTRLTVSGEGIGFDRWRAKTGEMEAAFKSDIECVEKGESPELVEITLTTKTIPGSCAYATLAKEISKPVAFVVGIGQKGTMTKSIGDIPGGHLLIAGTTGGGKSNWFKSALLSLLQTTPHGEFFLLDFKGGVEFAPFGKFPNVTVEKSMEGGLNVLRMIQVEMDRRFALLEKRGKPHVTPARDKLNHLFVAVDEASILYGMVPRNDPDKNKVAEARKITNDIAKRGRAAGISLVLATQKITKETIETSIQENITGRMCFRMNTLQGSMVVLGDKTAYELPDIPGRAIWQCGNERTEVQTPLLDGKDIERAAEIADYEHNEENKRTFHLLLGERGTPGNREENANGYFSGKHNEED